jgi:hypothetical protein
MPKKSGTPEMGASADCRATAEAAKLPGTSYSERGNRISMRQERPEQIDFYKLDSTPIRECLGRERPEGGHGLKLCDVVVRYRESPQATSSTVVFAELKGKHIGDALEQIDGSVHVVKPRVEELWQESRAKRWLAVIVHGGGAPRKTSDLKKSFKRRHGFSLEFKPKKCDVRDLLR